MRSLREKNWGNFPPDKASTSSPGFSAVSWGLGGLVLGGWDPSSMVGNLVPIKGGIGSIFHPLGSARTISGI